MTDPKQIVESGYDRIARQYLATKDADDPVTLEALALLVQGLAPAARVLDLGCGAGVPVTRWLAARFRVTGVDLSTRQLELARECVPDAAFVKADMTVVQFRPQSFDAVVSCHAIIHVPRGEQPLLVRQIFRWLKPRGRFLANWALRYGEGVEADWEGWGAPMWWSHQDRATNLSMLREAGFAILEAEEQTSGGETWLWVLAQRPPARARSQRTTRGPAAK